MHSLFYKERSVYDHHEHVSVLLIPFESTDRF
jgi:hypothetical protein